VEEKDRLDSITRRIIGAAIEVQRQNAKKEERQNKLVGFSLGVLGGK
jgi:hypothetical protein